MSDEKTQNIKGIIKYSIYFYVILFFLTFIPSSDLYFMKYAVSLLLLCHILLLYIIVFPVFKYTHYFYLSGGLVNLFFFRDIFTKFSPVEFYYLIVYYIILFSTFYFKKILQRVRVFDTIRNVAPRLKPLIEARFEIESKVSSLRNENLDLEYHKKNINKIYNQIKLINSTLQLKDMMELSKNILVDVIGLDNFVFYIKDKEEGYSRFLEHNISHEMQQYLQIFLRKKGDKFFDKITSYVKFAIEPEEVLSNLSNINIFPLILKEEILGMLLQYEDKRGKVDETIINNTKIVIRYISMGIKKAMLYNKVQELSQRDGLTLLYLRRTFNGFLEDEFLRAKRYKSKLSLIIFDIDLFKKLNDKYGHLFGDKVLAGIAGIILESIKDPLTASRYGGEEFIVTCPNMNKAQAYELADEIRKKVEKFKFNYNGNSVKTTISGGVAEFSVSMKNGSVLLKNTDDNLYKAKNSGRNKICK